MCASNGFCQTTDGKDHFGQITHPMNLLDTLDNLEISLVQLKTLPTRECISSIFSPLVHESRCPLCKDGEDLIHHLFFACFYSRVV
jgi:hypothetical protein